MITSSFCAYDIEILNLLKLNNQINIRLCKDYTYNLSDYSKFKLIQISDIHKLRELNFKGNNNELWEEKILRFIEIWNFSIHKKFKLNYKKSSDRQQFKQTLISFFLEKSYYSNDYRFLNAALKLSGSITKNETSHDLYNDLLTKYLLKLFNK